MPSATQAVFTTHGPSILLIFSGNISRSLPLASGHGWTQLIQLSPAWCVLPFKKPVSGELALNQKTYNYFVSKASVKKNLSYFHLFLSYPQNKRYKM